MKRVVRAASLALWFWSTGVAAQPSDDALLDLPTPKSAKSKPAKAEKPEAQPALPPAAEAPSEKPSAEDARRARQEARQKRRKTAEAATGEAQTSTVAPQDTKKVESPAAEKGAATASAVETIAKSPATTAAAARAAKPSKKPAAPEAPARPAKKRSAYDIAADSWHAAAPPEMCAQFKSTAIPDLVFHIQGKDLTYVLRPKGRNGGWSEDQLAVAKEAFGSWEGGPTPHTRTLDLVYQATLHFGCPYVTLISGIRKDRGGSRHSHGLAADIVLPGIDDEELAAYFRVQGFVGVGTYPRAKFVHVDTRDQSFFWVDRSKPNQHGRVVQVRKDESTAADAAARERGMEGFVNPARLQRALKVRATKKLKQHKAKLEREAAKRAASTAPAP